uniref:Uncharacterized protein n=1 Tax=Helianthus annuus TaxID=4232 RepID=A0A251TES4_HELAN
MQWLMALKRMIDTIGEWQELANGIPGKTPDEVKAYYKAVEHDLLEIEAGRVKYRIILMMMMMILEGNRLLRRVPASPKVEKRRGRKLPHGVSSCKGWRFMERGIGGAYRE